MNHDSNMRQNGRYHVGMIPDGNRRWAEERDLPPWEGHERGAAKAELFIEWCVNHESIDEASLYALSEENFRRPALELAELYRIYERELAKLLHNEKIHSERVRIQPISTDSRPLPASLMRLLERLQQATRRHENKTLNLLIGYTGQSEILGAVSSPMNRIRNLLFGLRESDLEKALRVRRPCDFVMRTGTEEGRREAKSGFLLWQTAYSEYFHIEKYFPEVTADDFDNAWRYFVESRRMGGR